MTPTTQKDITEAVKELQEALTEALQAQQAELNAKQTCIKAHYRLSLAREAIRALNFNN